MVKKEEEIVKLAKNKKSLRKANVALATALSVVSALLLGGAGLVMYNTEKGRHPFQIGKSERGTSEDSKPTNSPVDDESSLGFSSEGIQNFASTAREAMLKDDIATPLNMPNLQQWIWF